MHTRSMPLPAGVDRDPCVMTEDIAAVFLARAHAWYAAAGITVERVISDNGSCYRSKAGPRPALPLTPGCTPTTITGDTPHSRASHPPAASPTSLDRTASLLMAAPAECACEETTRWTARIRWPSPQSGPHTGDTDSLAALLGQHPGLASEQIHGTRTPLHVAADWPGYFPAGPATVRLLIGAGADPNVVVTDGTQGETPLHWAASSDDADVAAALISGGADIERPGGSIGTRWTMPSDMGAGTSPPPRAAWRAGQQALARRRPGPHAAGGGFPRRLPAPSPGDITEAFWQACHGGQRRTAERLLASGADPDATPGHSDQTAAQIAAKPGTQRENLVTWLHDRLQ